MKSIRKNLPEIIILAVVILSVLIAVFVTVFVNSDAEPSVQQPIGGECGTNGSNVMWSLDFSNNKLTISGQGEMVDFYGEEKLIPWEDNYYFREIYYIDISEGVTSIPSEVFSNCDMLTEISMSSTVLSIGDSVFSGCDSLETINVSDRNTSYISADGILFDKEKTVIIKYPQLKEGAFNIPESVEEIGKEAFYDCQNLTEINIPNGVEKIEESAFVGCSSLKKIDIPASVITIGDGAFAGCSTLKQVNIPDSVITIEGGAFWGCHKLTEIIIPSGVKVIGESAFTNCKMLSDIIVDEKNENYASIDGVLFNKNKTELVRYPENKNSEYIIPDSVKIIGEEAFAYCENLTGLRMSNNVTTINSGAFYSCKNLEKVNISNSVSKIEASTFSYCESLNYVNIPESILTIGESAFEFCNSLTEITIPKSVSKIDEYAFRLCPQLKKITILNPECEISEDNAIDKDTVICGYKKSTANQFAKKNRRKFDLYS